MDYNWEDIACMSVLPHLTFNREQWEYLLKQNKTKRQSDFLFQSWNINIFENREIWENSMEAFLWLYLNCNFDQILNISENCEIYIWAKKNQW